MKIVSSFKVDSWEVYSRKFLETFAEFWPKSVTLYAYYHDGELPEDAPRPKNIVYRNLMHDKEMLAYREKNAMHSGTANGSQPYNWRMDAIKWCHKVYAMTALAHEMRLEEDQPGWLCWIDADTVTTKKISLKTIKEKFLSSEAELVHLGRTAADYSETSFMGFNMNSIRTHSILADLRGIYNTGEVIAFREWHDGFIFERLLNLHKAHGLVTLNLSEDCKDLQAFNQSILSKYMTHFKGPKKLQPPMRYGQLIELVGFYKPRSLVETGTWNGGHAIDMCRTALNSHSDKVHYTGYDLFEEGSEELDKKELNSKKRMLVEEVTKKFEDLAKQFPDRFSFRLVKGDTNETMKHHRVDFAYIDGGHSIETTKNDYEHLEESKVIVFDDYFKKDKDGQAPKEEHSGTNAVFDSLAGDNKWVMPSQDMVLGGGVTHLAVLVNEGEPPPNKDRIAVPIVVNPIDCVEKTEIFTNIEDNLALIDKWIEKKYKWNYEEVVIASGGPSLKNYLKEIKEAAANTKVVCVKHSYPTLIQAGIVPDFCIILDPRPLTGTSTHGIVRKTLFKTISKKTIFLVASMTEPSVTQYLLDKGATVIGWNAYSQTVAQQDIMKDKMLVTGGTCAAMRSVGLMHTLGFRSFKLYGFDSCLAEAPPEKEQKNKTEEGTPKFLEINVNGKSFWTTGELLAQAQDFEKLMERLDVDMDLQVHGEGIVPELWKSKAHRRPSLAPYEELING